MDVKIYLEEEYNMYTLYNEQPKFIWCAELLLNYTVQYGNKNETPIYGYGETISQALSDLDKKVKKELERLKNNEKGILWHI